MEARSRADFESAYQTALSVGAEALIPISSRLMTVDRAGIIAFAARHRLLLASGWGPWAREGALLSYGPDLDEITRRSAAHVDKILRGASPADIPVEQPTRFQLVLSNTWSVYVLCLTLRIAVLDDFRLRESHAKPRRGDPRTAQARARGQEGFEAAAFGTKSEEFGVTGRTPAGRGE